MNSWYPKRDICKKKKGLQRHIYPIQNYLLNSPIHNPTENKYCCCLFKNPRAAGEFGNCLIITALNYFFFNEWNKL